jgi:hypothetical protein
VYLALGLLVILAISCHNKNDTGIQSMDNNTIHSQLQQIQLKKIYFGHQSVGNNIINGLKDIVKSYPDIHMNFVSVNNPTQLPTAYFADSYIGENTKPETKCESFTNKIEQTFSGDLNIAFMKFCYVDIQVDSDVDSIFRTYQTTIDSLKNRYPKITFVHVTVPLVSKADGLKHFIKSMLGRTSWEDLENIKRNQFNAKLKDYYRNELIFDLATEESTYPNGQRENFTKDGQTYYRLIKDYSDDGGHLNKKSSQFVAMKLLDILWKASTTR